MSDGSTVIYQYDGSFDGLMCCIFESFEKKEMPCKIEPATSSSPSLFKTRLIETDLEKAKRVHRSIVKKISLSACQLVEHAYLTFVPDKEIMILRFLRLGYKMGPKIMNYITEESVNFLQKAVKHLGREAMLFRQFVRFSVYNDCLVAIIEPKNFVISLLSDHFCDRYADENFIIYDKNHKQALVYTNGKSDIIFLDEFELPEVDDDEFKYRVLWKQFFDTIAIKERINPRCQNSHMPKRYRGQMTEFMQLDKGRIERVRKLPSNKDSIFKLPHLREQSNTKLKN